PTDRREHRPHPRRGAEPRPLAAGTDPAALELRDPDEQAPAEPARGAAGAQGQAPPPRAPAAQAADRAALPDPSADPGRSAPVYPDPAEHRGCERPGCVHRRGGGPDHGIFGWDSTARQHRRRSLPPLRLRRSEAPDRPPDCHSSDRLSRGGHAATAQGQRTSRLEGAALLSVGRRNVMSKFFKALEQAEQERALRRHPVPSEPTSERGSIPPETAPSPAPRSALELPMGVSDGLEEHLVSLLAPTSFEAEQYRELRHLVEQFHKSTDLSVVAVSSPCAADGKTTTSINLAGALVQAPDARVLLVDCDVRGAALATHLGLDDRTGPG